MKSYNQEKLTRLEHEEWLKKLEKEEAEAGTEAGAEQDIFETYLHHKNRNNHSPVCSGKRAFYQVALSISGFLCTFYSGKKIRADRLLCYW